MESKYLLLVIWRHNEVCAHSRRKPNTKAEGCPGAKWGRQQALTAGTRNTRGGGTRQSGHRSRHQGGAPRSWREAGWGYKRLKCKERAGSHICVNKPKPAGEPLGWADQVPTPAIINQWKFTSTVSPSWLAVWSWESDLSSLFMFPHMQTEDHNSIQHIVQMMWGLN